MDSSPFTAVVAREPAPFFAKLLLGSSLIEADTLSHVTSLPGCPDSHWHVDVDLTFPEAMLAGKSHLPAQGMVLVAPLTPVTRVTGPTEFCVVRRPARRARPWRS